MLLTSLVSGLTAGVIVYTSYNKNTGINYNTIQNDAALKQFLEVYSSITTDYYEDINKTEMLQAAIDSMLKYLDDKYTSLLDSKQTSLLNDSLEGEYEGIGVAILDHKITEVFEDSPAEKAGLKADDIITMINGEDVSGVSSDDLVSLIKNSKDSKARITVLREGVSLEYELTVSKLFVPAIRSKIIDDTNIGYIRLATFSNTVSKQVERALDKFDGKISALIIDLRINSGGYLNAAEDVSNLFLEKGKVIYSLKTKNESNTVKDVTERKTTYPIVVLVDENTASAAEILAAALKDSYGATLVGVKTYGKGKVQQVISLIDGSMAKYTTGKWYTPSGINIDKNGIEPDYVVELELRKDESGKVVDVIDTQLEKAIELLK